MAVYMQHQHGFMSITQSLKSYGNVGFLKGVLGGRNQMTNNDDESQQANQIQNESSFMEID